MRSALAGESGSIVTSFNSFDPVDLVKLDLDQDCQAEALAGLLNGFVLQPTHLKQPPMC